MSSVAEVEAKFEAQREIVKRILEDVEGGVKSSDEGFKSINEILRELKTMVGIGTLIRPSRTGDGQEGLSKGQSSRSEEKTQGF